ncbi:MAG TPA: XRE family transcriptional regulator [Companilactobacillus farciminis]|uniref:XRE family transcriptional regulator n=1 Tax=Companilactobacillus farciminis TaxID=1612 RepID=A0A921LA41_9LACO|nr:XRE family transcriptional regulator [Companilactobacillus farciminis]
MEFKDKIKLQRKSAKMTQMQLANLITNRLGETISPNAVSGWERGANKPTMDKVTILADIFNVSISYFFDESDVLETGSISIPLLGEIACGEPITATENVDSYIDRTTAGLPNGNLFYLECKGESMSPTIPDKSFVLIREQPEVEDGEIAAVLVNGDSEVTLKRVKKQGDVIFLMPDNSNYSPYIISDSNPGRIIGKAIEFTSKL